MAQLDSHLTGNQEVTGSILPVRQHSLVEILSRRAVVSFWRKNVHKYSRLPLSRIPRDCLKYFKISVLRHIRVETVRKRIN